MYIVELYTCLYINSTKYICMDAEKKIYLIDFEKQSTISD